MGNKKDNKRFFDFLKVCFCGILLKEIKWQRARDSNPRRREPRRFSKPVQSTNSVNSLHILMVRMIGIEPILPNGNWILSPTRLPVPPHSLFLGSTTQVFHSNWTGIIIAFLSFVKSFLHKFLNFIKKISFNKN